MYNQSLNQFQNHIHVYDDLDRYESTQAEYRTLLHVLWRTNDPVAVTRTK